MPFLFLGFVFVTLLWLLWAIALLAWPIALVLAAAVLFRAVARGSLRFADASSPTGGGAQRNTAFDDYRRETLGRLDEEQGKFREFLNSLRRSKDKDEFDRFMAERRPNPRLPAV
jgi:hypothetical protein